jgi:hypothetical protein
VKGRKILTYFIVLIASFGIFSVLSVKGAEAAVEPGTGGRGGGVVGGVVKKCQNDFERCKNTNCAFPLPNCYFDESGCPVGTWLNKSDCIYSLSIKNSCPSSFDVKQYCNDHNGGYFVDNNTGNSFCVFESYNDAKNVVNDRNAADCFVLSESLIQALCSCGTTGCPPGTIPNPLDPNCEGDKNTLGYLIGRVLPFIPVALGIVLLIMIIIGGLKVATAGDNEEAKKKGLSTITNALIGAGILLLALVIVALLEAIFKVKILYGLNIG